MNWQVIQGESLEAMRGMADDSFSLIVADPPYFKVKDEDWDNQWKTKGDFLKWIGLLCKEWRRILKPNGSLYVFASPQLAREVGNVIAEDFNILNEIRWVKEAGWHNKAEKESLRSYLTPNEAIIFAEQCCSEYEDISKALHKEVYAPLGRYIQTERERAGLTRNQVEVGLGYIGKSDPSRGTALCYRWEEGSSLPTGEAYSRMRDYLNSVGAAAGRPYLSREYEDLRREYEDLRREYETLRRPFNAMPDAPYTDVWDFPTVGNYKGKHPCEKPLEMMRHIVSLSSREGDSVLDSFAGSFVLGEAALSLNRPYVGIDGSAKWCERGRRKLSAYGKQGSVTLHSVVEFKRANYRPAKPEREMPLFEAVA